MWNKSVYVELRDFGKNMQYLAIFMLLSLIPGIGPVAMILYLIFMFSALKNIRLMYYSLNDQNLESFRIKMVSSITRGFLSIFSIIPGGIFLAIGLVMPMQNYISIIIGSLLLLLGFILMISSHAIERAAWKNLNAFLKENRQMFPEMALREVLEGTENLETGALLYSLFIFGITIIIGYILKVIGYFKLAKLSQLEISIPMEPVIEVVQSSPQSSSLVLEQPSDIVNFCPMCGAKVSQHGIYCAECGSKVK